MIDGFEINDFDRSIWKSVKEGAKNTYNMVRIIIGLDEMKIACFTLIPD